MAALTRRHSMGGQGGPSLPEWISQFLNGEYQTPNISDFPAWYATHRVSFQRQRSLAPHSLKNGVVLCSLLHKFNNDLIDIEAARAVRCAEIIESA